VEGEAGVEPLPRPVEVQGIKGHEKEGGARHNAAGRLTNAHSKKLRNRTSALELFLCFYNFCRLHETIRCTPAMAAGVSKGYGRSPTCSGCCRPWSTSAAGPGKQSTVGQYQLASRV
jgi:hypothetical protein